MARHAVARMAELPPGSMREVDVDGRKLVLVNLNGEVHALDGICSHAYSELARGFFAGDLLTCALHLSQFDVRTGQPISPPATEPIAIYAVFVDGDTIFVEMTA